jgi:hypothetical protein
MLISLNRFVSQKIRPLPGSFLPPQTPPLKFPPPPQVSRRQTWLSRVTGHRYIEEGTGPNKQNDCAEGDEDDDNCLQHVAFLLEVSPKLGMDKRVGR